MSGTIGPTLDDEASRSSRSFVDRKVLDNLLFSTRFATIWIAFVVLLVVCQIIAPSTLSSASWSANLMPFGSVVAIAALGQMLVIMMGGIDLSMAASISLLANVLVGVSKGSDDRVFAAVVAVLVCAVLIGLVNGLLVAVIELNPLIVTLATGLILAGITSEYRVGLANNSSVPKGLSTAVIEKWWGLNKAFVVVVALMLVLSVMLRSSTVGRRFQAVGANRRAAWIGGIHVRSYVVSAYIGASVTAGLAGILIGGIVQTPRVDQGSAYLLGPVAAVVLGGAALSGGLASPASTWLAAFFVTILNQMLAVRGLSVASANVMFGLSIVLGMMISGDRIAELIGRLLARSSTGSEPAAPQATQPVASSP
jgi:ribose transport system permease protein